LGAARRFNARASEGINMARLFALGGLIGLAVLAAPDARAQTDLSAGLSPAQLFAANCSACHRSPAGLARGRNPVTVAYFLRDHYTTRPGTAAALASYIVNSRGSARPAARETPDGQQTGTAAPVAQPQPLQRLANTTVERLRSFAADADPAQPSAADAPERGSERLLWRACARSAAIVRYCATRGRRRSEKGCKRFKKYRRIFCSGKTTRRVSATRSATQQRDADDAIERRHALKNGRLCRIHRRAKVQK
jgi:hypothetical protein